MEANAIIQHFITANDQSDFARLPADAKRAVTALLPVLSQIHATCTSSAMSLNATCNHIAKISGFHERKLKRSYEAFLKCGWRGIVDKRYVSAWWNSDSEKGLPEAFLEYWKGLCERNQRCNKQAYTKLIREWKMWKRGSGKPIPGYENCPECHPGTDAPFGWSYRNLCLHAPNDVELAAARHGRGAALAKLPGVRTTRANMYVGAEIQFDDMWHDFECNVFGANQTQSRRLLEFGCVDVFSGYILPPGLKPRLKSTDEGKMKQLNGADFRFYLAYFLTHFGYNPRGTVLNMEHGTAAINSDIERAILACSGGAITIRRGGIAHSNRAALPGQFEARRKGNFRTKALKEGLGKLIHNSLADLPGQIGMSPDDMPAEAFGRQKENELMLAMVQLLPELEVQLKFGYLSFQQASDAIFTVYDRINNRTDHAMEGFVEAGMVVNEFRLDPISDNWTNVESVKQYPAEFQDKIALVIRDNAMLRRSRKMSPAEVFLKGKSELVKLPMCFMPEILGQDLGEKRVVKNKLFEFDAQEMGGKQVFLARVFDEAGLPVLLDNGREYMTFVNPFCSEKLIVCDKDSGAYLGECERWNKVDRTDIEAVNRQYGKTQAMLTEATNEASRRMGIDRLQDDQINTAAIKKLAFSENKKARLQRNAVQAGRMVDKLTQDADEVDLINVLKNDETATENDGFDYSQFLHYLTEDPNEQ